MSFYYVCTCMFVLFVNWDLLTFCVYVRMYICIYVFIIMEAHFQVSPHYVTCHLTKSVILQLIAIKTIVK